MAYKLQQLLCGAFFIVSSALLSGCLNGTDAGTTTIGLDASQYTLNQGSSVAISVSNNGSAIANEVTASGLPSGVTATTCSSIAAGSTCTVTLTASTNTRAALTTITIAGTNTNSVSASLNTTVNSLALGGPPGAIVLSMATTASAIYAATFGGMFTQSLGGSNWVAINSGLSNLSMTSVAASNSMVVAVSNYGNVYQLNATTWSALPSASLPTGSSIKTVAIDNAGNVFAIVNDGQQTLLYELLHNANTWTLVSGLTGVIYELVSNAGQVAVLTKDETNHPYIYQWNGSSFVNLNYTSGGQSDSSLAISANGDVYVRYVISSTGYVTYHANGGSSWSAGVSTSVTAGLIVPTMTLGNFYYSEYKGGNVYFFDGSSNNNITPPFAGDVADVNVLDLFNNNLYEGTSVGIYKRQGSTWSVDNTGFNSGLVYSLTYNNALYAGSAMYSLTGQPLYLSYTEQGGNWTPVGNGTDLGNSTKAEALTSFQGTAYLATDVGIYKLGSQWSEILTAGSGSVSAVSINSLAADADDVYVMGTGNAFYATTGSVLTPIITPPSGIDFSDIFPAEVGFYAIGQLQDNSGSVVYYYTGGTSGTWQLKLTTSLSPFAVVSMNNDIYIGQADSNANTANVCQLVNATTCDNVTTQNLTGSFYSLTILNNTFYLGGDNGLYSWKAGQPVWAQIVNNNSIIRIVSDPEGNFYLGTFGGVYMIPADSL